MLLLEKTLRAFIDPSRKSKVPPQFFSKVQSEITSLGIGGEKIRRNNTQTPALTGSTTAPAPLPSPSPEAPKDKDAKQDNKEAKAQEQKAKEKETEYDKIQKKIAQKEKEDKEAKEKENKEKETGKKEKEKEKDKKPGDKKGEEEKKSDKEKKEDDKEGKEAKEKDSKDSKESKGKKKTASADDEDEDEEAEEDEEKVLAKLEKKLEDLYEVAAQFSMQADVQLIECASRLHEKSSSKQVKKPTSTDDDDDSVSSSTSSSDAEMKPNAFNPTREELLHYSLIENCTTRDLQIRLATLQLLNEMIRDHISKIDLCAKPGSSDYADVIRSSRGLISWSTKSRIWQRALDSTVESSNRASVTINRFMASRMKERGKCDIRGKRMCFSQLFRQLYGKKSPRMFRLRKNERAFQVRFLGEGGIDAGGLYREAVSVIAQELTSEQLPLFILCPNGRDKLGENRDKFVPRPSSTKSLHIAMYEFIGQLFGLAMRTGELLPVDLPSIVWKSLVHDTITEADVLAIDRLSFKLLENMREIQAKGVTEEEFNSKFSEVKFVINGSDGKSYDLMSGGRNKTLTFKNREEYCQAVIDYRKNEFTKQCEAMRRGLATIVPYSLLSLFTWQELEKQVCGEKQMDVELFEQMTEYHGCTRSDAHIEYFWKIIRNRFDNMERAKFLQFVWGRSRLPLRAQDFERKFTISQMSGSAREVDNYMPVSHTCFFSLDLPAYSAEDIMYKRLLYAITHCTAIDADMGNVDMTQAMREDSDDDEEETAADE
eukprot:TRINITY_DN1143_c0_g3_i2.p1 TRINITY_DN1143_c0_g3~~TRINITY_DN1143_c0_g3_i2.p1  ORF type:complete len:806 (-),score=272.19 TRINITY_DN1143_c0_g3_i2:175-2481(-)